MPQRHECCKGVQQLCFQTCLSTPFRQCGDKKLTECHHIDIVCIYQYKWYGHDKFCDCSKHEELQRIKYEKI